MAVRVALLLAAAAAAALAYTDQCSQYPDCATCLNVTFQGDERAYCGWCHVNIQYNDSTTGKQCADIRDRPWKCPGVYDTYQCTSGFICDFATGQCTLAPPGSGYANLTTCQQHCFPTPQTYICNTTSYQCQECPDASFPGCQDKTSACSNCQAPPPPQFKCVGTGMNATCQACAPFESNCGNYTATCENCGPPPQYKCVGTGKDAKCVSCQPGESGCANATVACQNCGPNPPPTPPPPTPPPQPQKQYQCNNVTFQCEEAPSGLLNASCTQTCSNSTPPEMMGVWRGFEAQVGFQFGEWNYTFSATKVVVEDNNQAVSVADVSIAGNLQFKFISGPLAPHTYYALQVGMSNGPETTSIALCFGAADQPAPNTFEEAMTGANGAFVHILSQCNSWKSKQCVFEGSPIPTIPSIRRVPEESGANKYRRKANSAHIGHTADPCNAFMTCTECVGQDPSGDIECGWCMGATIVYNDTGDSHLHCGGFVKGQAPPFVCDADFRTESCQGWICNYTASQPTCQLSEDGTFSTQDDCEAVCQPPQYARCNLQTKQCESCDQGSPNCTQTKDECNAICGQQRAKCDVITHQCTGCDPSSDPNCTMTTGDCETYCNNHHYGICDPAQGVCQDCDPGSTPGCVLNCNNTCTQDKTYGCDQSDPTQPICRPNTGNETLNDCASSCRPAPPTPPTPPPTPPPSNATYGCDWSNASQPVCVSGHGSQTQQDCLQNCQAVQYAKCNLQDGQCEQCTPGISDPGCIYTQGYCLVACKKASNVGVYRGNQINLKYHRGEFDFTFNDNGQVVFEMYGPNPVKYEATFTNSGAATEGAPITLSITAAPSGGPFPISSGDSLSGMFSTQDGEQGVTSFMYLGLGLPKNPAGTFDDAMSKLEFVLVKCRNDNGNGTATSDCDFSPAKLNP